MQLDENGAEKFDCVTLFILEFVRSVVANDLTERTDSLISVVNNYQPLWITQDHGVRQK